MATRNELVKLSDAGDLTVTEDEDIRGDSVKDRDGEDLGDVDDLLIDVEEQKVRFLVVASGGFLGMGEDKSFIPVDAVTGIGDDVVTIDRSRQQVAGAPVYDPELINEPDYAERVFGYYGYPPFWGAGYLYPAYPGYAPPLDYPRRDTGPGARPIAG